MTGGVSQEPQDPATAEGRIADLEWENARLREINSELVTSHNRMLIQKASADATPNLAESVLLDAHRALVTAQESMERCLGIVRMEDPR